MDWILKALESIQKEIQPYVPSSSRAPSAPFAPSSPIKQINEHLYEVCKPVGRPSVELVFFHGLQLETSKETYLTTWVSRGGSELWLDWLSKSFPRARILLVSYDASARKTEKGVMDKYATCENLLTSLIRGAGGIGQDGCPVVLVGHCLGGLIMKQLCLSAIYMLSVQDERDEGLENLVRNIRGLFFYATPHHGSRLADTSMEFPKAPLFEILTTLNTETARCNEEFRKLRRKYRWKAVGVGESSVVTLGQFKGFVVVEEASARHDVDTFYTIPTADHFTVCRPDSTKSSSFYMLRNFIADLLQEDKNRDGPKVDLHDKVVGLEPQVRKLQKLLKTTERLGIVGMGGVGKTTLAQHLYNVISGSFEYSCFLQDVKISMARKQNPNDLRRKIIGSLCCGQHKVDENWKWSSLKGKRVLIVLDDAETNSQVQVMTASDGFDGASRVIVTSRDSRFLIGEKFQCHPADQLNAVESKRLFCLHAFDSATPPSGYEERVVRMLKKCDGLPLALEIAGKYLYNQPEGTRWDDALEILSRAEPLDGNEHDGLWSILKTSYDSLAHSEREMFLDIATCFHDEPLESVKETWKAQWNSVDTKWQNLLDKNLVKIYRRRWFDEVVVKMHEVLRDLGRSISCPNPQNVLGHSRVSSSRDLPSWPLNQGKPAVKVLKVSKFGGDSFYSRSPNPIINIQSLHRLEELEILWLRNVDLQGPCHFLPQNLVSLRMESCGWSTDRSFSNIRNAFSRQSWRHPKLRHVHILDSYFDVKGLGQFQALEHLTFESGVAALPDTFDQNPALRYLIIKNHPFTALPKSLCELRALEHMEIWMPNLEAIPEKTFCQLGALKYLRIDCFDITTLPTSLGELRTLEDLNITLPRLTTLPETLSQLGALKRLRIACQNPRVLPYTLEGLQGLQQLIIHGYEGLTALPNAFGSLEHLEHLEIGSRGISTISESIAKLRALRILKIRGWKDLTALPDAFGNLEYLEHLEIESCGVSAIPESIGKLQALRILKIRGCKDLTALPNAFGSLEHLEHLEIGSCGISAISESIGKLRALRIHKIRGCKDLTALPDAFGNLEHLEHLEIESCGILAIPESIGKLRALRILKIIDCPHLKALPDALLEFEDLEHLVIKDCPHLKRGAQEFMFEGSITIVSWRLIMLHRKAMEKVSGSEYEGALADLNSWSLEGLEPQYQGFFLQERGITKRLVGDLHGALQDLTAALEVFSKADDRSPYTYNCWKHRGFVNFLLEDLDGARKDGTMALKLCYPENVMSPSLGDELVTFMHFRLKGTKEIREDHEIRVGRPGSANNPIGMEIWWEMVYTQILEKVRTSQFRDALAMWDGLDAEVSGSHHRGFFLQERGIMKRFAGDLHGALEDLTSALEINNDDYECCKHRGYVNFLLGDIARARIDGTMALKLCSLEYPQNVMSSSLGDELVTFMHFRLKGTKGMGEDTIQWEKAYPQILEKVRTSQFRDALAMWDAFDAEVSGYYNRLLFLQERGIMKRFVGDLHGALEDLTSALEINDDDYECCKHRGYVNFLLGDIARARIDAKKCLALGLKQGSDNCLGTGSVAFLEFNL